MKRTDLCEECHVIEAAYTSEDTGRRLCCACYFGDNMGKCCDPGECEFPGCENNPETVSEVKKDEKET